MTLTTLLAVGFVQSFSGAHLFPGAVSDPSGSCAFVPDPQGGIQAVSVGTGKRLWASREATWPLECLSNAVVAAAPVARKPSAFQILCLDPSSGSVLRRSEPIPTVTWATALFGYVQPAGHSFDLSSEAIDSHTVVLRWAAKHWASGKIGIESDSGSLQIDTQTCVTGKPFLGAQPSKLERSNYFERRVDTTRPNSTMLGRPVQFESVSLHFSASNLAADERASLTVVATDPKTSAVLWELPIARDGGSSEVKG